jgi:hypothetical protein
MSFPVPPHAMAAVAAISPLDGLLQMFNTNPYFIGLMMLILNLGGRFIGLEVTKKQEQFLQHPWVRRVLIFTVLFVATRNIWVAFWMSLTVILLLGYIFNENSALCIYGGGLSGSKCASEEKNNDLTPEEKEILQRLSAKAQRYQTSKDTASESDDDVDHIDVYAANLSLLKN